MTDTSEVTAEMPADHVWNVSCKLCYPGMVDNLVNYVSAPHIELHELIELKE